MAGLLGGLTQGLSDTLGLGFGAGAGSQAQSMGYSQANIDMIKQMMGSVPDQQKPILYEQLKAQGILTPELEKQIQLGESQVSQIQEDPSLKAAQMEALQGIQARGKVGLTPEDRARLNEIRQQTAGDTEAKRQQIMQTMQARGQGGSGAELMAQLQSAQGGSNQEANQGLQLGGLSSQNALNALAQSGQLGGQIRGQDFGIAQQKAAAADAVSQFNAQNQVSQQARNVASANQAQQANLTNAQRIADANTSQANAEKYRQAMAPTAMWQQRASLLSPAASANNAMAGQYANMAQQQEGAGLRQLGGLVQTGASIYSMANGMPVSSQKNPGDTTAKAAHGGIVTGQPKVQGDSEANDQVRAMLSPGEVVIPRSIVEHEDAPVKAAKFIEAIKKKHEGRKIENLTDALHCINERLTSIEKKSG